MTTFIGFILLCCALAIVTLGIPGLMMGMILVAGLLSAVVAIIVAAAWTYSRVKGAFG